MQRNYISNNQREHHAEYDAQPLTQQLLRLVVVAAMLIAVFSLLGERIFELYMQTAVEFIF